MCKKEDISEKNFMKIYINHANEKWIVDRFREEFYEHNPLIATENIAEADILWIIAPWSWKKIPRRYLKSKKVICTVHHIDEIKFIETESKDFYKLDKYIDIYHTISDKSEIQLSKLTSKQIYNFPFWVNSKLWFDIKDKEELRKKFNIHKSKFLVGSFQRDTEGKDGVSPKLSKGPDQFFEIVNELNKSKEIMVILGGYRRTYLINLLDKHQINYIYYEKTSIEMLNELYNILDLYLVTSRIEGGPQAIFECALSKTPILSTDVGIAKQILSEESIFEMNNFGRAKPNTAIAYKNAISLDIPNGFVKFINMFSQII